MSRTWLAMKAAKKRLSKQAGELLPIDLSVAKNIPVGVTRAFQNNRYIVLIFDDKQMCLFGKVLANTPLIFVQRVDDKPIPNHWSELQKIKNKIFGDESQAIEFYPPESELVNNANIYWLWIIPSLVISPVKVS